MESWCYSIDGVVEYFEGIFIFQVYPAPIHGPPARPRWAGFAGDRGNEMNNALLWEFNVNEVHSPYFPYTPLKLQAWWYACCFLPKMLAYCRDGSKLRNAYYNSLTMANSLVKLITHVLFSFPNVTILMRSPSSVQLIYEIMWVLN